MPRTRTSRWRGRRSGSCAISSAPATCPPAAQATAASALPDGAALYAYNVRWHTTTSLSPQQIHEIGLAEVKRIRARDGRGHRRSAASRAATRSSAASCAPIRGSSSPTPPRCCPAYRDIAKRADPGAGAAVRPAAAARRTAWKPRARRRRAVADHRVLRAGRVRRPAGRATCSPTPTSSTRARSGRWRRSRCTRPCRGITCRSALAQELEGAAGVPQELELHRVRRGLGAVRGVARRRDGLLHRIPYSKFGQLTYEMWRAVRLVVDTGMHSMGWTRQQAIDFFSANAAKTEQDIVVEVDRYIVVAGPGARLQDRRAEDQGAARDRRARSWRRVRRPRVPRRRARRRARCRSTSSNRRLKAWAAH